MKITQYSLLFVITFAITACGNKEHKSKGNKGGSLEEIYLGQNPPGIEPIRFAPNIINTTYREAEMAISPDLTEFYFRRRGGTHKKQCIDSRSV